MKHYYESNGITLYHADCREIAVPHDLLVTDPPYGQEFVSGKAGSKKAAPSDKMFDMMLSDYRKTLASARTTLNRK